MRKTSEKATNDASKLGKENMDNHGNQLNPNNKAYWQSKGLPDRPNNWKQLYQQGKKRGK